MQCYCERFGAAEGGFMRHHDKHSTIRYLACRPDDRILVVVARRYSCYIGWFIHACDAADVYSCAYHYLIKGKA